MVVGANFQHQEMAPMAMNNQTYLFKIFFVLSYSFHIHFCSIVLFILHILLQGSKGAQLAIMDVGQICFDIVFSFQHIDVKNP